MSPRTLTILLATLAVGLLGGFAAERLVEKTGVLAVEIPVQVLLDGEPVKGLTAENFEVSMKGQKLALTRFEPIDLATFTPERVFEEPPPVVARRHFLFLFDLTFSEVGPVIRARAAVDGLLDQMHATDLVGVAVYTSTTGPQLVLGFTSDRAQVRKAVETLGVPELIEGGIDPLRITLVEPDVMDSGSDLITGDGDPSDARAQITSAINDALAEHLRAIESDIKTMARRDLRGKVQNLTKDFGNLARMMGAIRGRKYVVYLSEGFDSNVLFADADQREVQRMNNASAEGRYWEVNSDQRFGDATAQSALNSMIEEFRRADCVIQSVDIGAAHVDESVRGGRSASDALFIMANETGGEFYQNFNDLSTAMVKVLERTAVTYNLVVEPKGIDPDGKFHKLKIKLRGGPKGATLIHRPGFYAPGSVAADRRRDQLSAGTLILAGREMGDLQVSVLATPFAGERGRAYVPVLVEIDGYGLSRSLEEPRLPTEIYGYALDRSQRIRGYFVQQMTLDMEQVGDFVRQNGVKYFGGLELEPGEYSLRVLVRNPETGAMRVEVLPLTVPPLDATAAFMLPPLMPDPQGKWLLARDEKSASKYAFPFMAGDQPFLPSALPTLTPGESRPVYLFCRGLAPDESRIAARLTDDAGAALDAGVAIEVAGRMAGATPGTDVIVATARVPERLGGGDYRLEVTVGEGDSAMTGTIPIRVVPGR